ncbi:MAG: ABC transporter substrate-binding protein [Proteobacteria bacterium]|nr:ABC transporter substrate-binding protein [Pseudomonadota bacterium]
MHTCEERLSERARATDNPGASANINSTPNPVDVNNSEPKRLAVLSPTGVEIIFALGAGDRVVGATHFTTFPPEAKKLPNIGGVIDINYERIAALRPDLIIAQTSNERLKEFANKRRIPLMNLKIESTEDVFATCRNLGSRLGLAGPGEALAKQIESELADVKKHVEGLEPVSCFVSVDRRSGQLASLLSTGRGTFLSQMVEMVGGRNIFDDVETNYPIISKETLLVRAPQVVLEFKPGADVLSEEIAGLKKDWNVLPGLPAVQNGRIHVIHHDDALMPGPRIGEVARAVAKALHPSALDTKGEDK